MSMSIHIFILNLYASAIQNATLLWHNSMKFQFAVLKELTDISILYRRREHLCQFPSEGLRVRRTHF